MKNQMHAQVRMDTPIDDPLCLVPEELRSLIPGFLDRREKELLELRQMLDQQDFASISNVGHKLKGTGAGYGFQLISDIGQELELAAQAQDRAGVQRSLQQLSMVVINLKGILRLDEKLS